MRPEHEEELEVLQSIYEGDSNFSIINNTTFQYKFENESENKSFIVELEWGPEYPDEAPKFNVELFFNKHLLQSVKDLIYLKLKEQAEINLGMSMTFTLFEWLKEVKDELVLEQPLHELSYEPDIADGVTNISLDTDVKKKKERMTKAQKRRLWDHQTAAGERERGWDWVDIVKHLSQHGGATCDVHPE